MKKILFILLLIYFLPLFSTVAQEDKSFPVLKESGDSAMKITRTGYYKGEELWGLIDGGADLYLEYGFDKLELQLVTWDSMNFRIEVYRMLNPRDAFGIFSVSRYKCNINDTLTKYICITPFQVQAAVGNYYFSISNERGTEQALDLTVELFVKLFSQTKEPIFEIPEYFNKETFSPYKDQLKFIKGKLGIQNGFPIWEDLFEGYENYEAYILPINRDDQYAYISKIKFASEKDAQKFIDDNSQKIKGSTITKFERLSPDELIFIESDFPEQEMDKLLMK